MGIVLFADRGFQRYRLLSNLDDFPHLLFRNAHFLGDLIGAGLPAVLLYQLPIYPDKLVDGFYHMHRDPNGPCLIGNGSGNSLMDPPGRISGELIAFTVVKFFHRLDKPQVALLDQIQKQHPATHIPLGNGYHQPEVGLGQLVLGLLVSLSHTLGDLYLFLGGEQRYLADLLEIHTHGVVDIDAFCGRQHRFHLGDLLVNILGDLYILHHVDVHLFQSFVDFLYLLLIQILFLKGLHDGLVAENALLLAGFQQFLDLALLGFLGLGLCFVFAHMPLLICLRVSMRLSV